MLILCIDYLPKCTKSFSFLDNATMVTILGLYDLYVSCFDFQMESNHSLVGNQWSSCEFVASSDAVVA